MILLKDKIVYLDEEEAYPIIFTLNVMKTIQNEYGTMQEWQKLIGLEEPDINAMLFGLTEMVNEAIDILNEETDTNIPFKNEKQVARVVTKMGLNNATLKLTESVKLANESITPEKNE